MREKLEEAGVVGAGDDVRTKSFAEKGVAITPAFTQIQVGDTRTFYVRVARRLGLPAGTAVTVSLSKAAATRIEVVGTPIDLDVDPVHEDVLRGSFVLRGVAVGSTAQVSCQIDSLSPVFADVQVTEAEPRDVDIQDNLAFQHRKYVVRPESRKPLRLRARFERLIVDAPSVKYTAADDSVLVLRARRPLELVDGTTYYEGSVVVEGKKLNGKTTVIAEVDGRSAECSVEVAAREEDGIDLAFELVAYSLGENYRAIWDREEANKLLITTQHESIRRYLGPAEQGYPGQHLEPFRVLLAELISDNVCRRIVLEQARALPLEFDSDRVYLHHNKLMREFTPIAHRVQLASPSV